MATRSAKKKAGAAAPQAKRRDQRKTEIMSIAFDPRTRYAIELAARIQRIPASTFIQNAAFDEAMTTETSDKRSVSDLVGSTYDLDERVRLLRLAGSRPDLLTVTEQRVKKVVDAAARHYMLNADLSRHVTTSGGMHDPIEAALPWILANWSRIEALAEGPLGHYSFEGFTPVDADRSASSR